MLPGLSIEQGTAIRKAQVSHATGPLSGARIETEESFDQVLNRLWTGNSAGAVTSLSVIASSKVAYAQVAPSLLAFTCGIAALGVAALLSLMRRRRHVLLNQGGVEHGVAAERDARTERALVAVAITGAGMFSAGMFWGIGLTFFILLAA